MATQWQESVIAVLDSMRQILGDDTHALLIRDVVVAGASAVALEVLEDMTLILNWDVDMRRGTVVISSAFTGCELCRFTRMPDDILASVRFAVATGQGAHIRNIDAAVYLNNHGTVLSGDVKCDEIELVSPQSNAPTVPSNSQTPVFIIEFKAPEVEQLDIPMEFTEIMYAYGL